MLRALLCAVLAGLCLDSGLDPFRSSGPVAMEDPTIRLFLEPTSSSANAGERPVTTADICLSHREAAPEQLEVFQK